MRRCILPGNCLLCALLLWLFRGGRLKGLNLRTGGPLHWVVRVKSGEVWHFRRWVDVLPHPLCYLVFLGHFERLQGRDERGCDNSATPHAVGDTRSTSCEFQGSEVVRGEDAERGGGVAPRRWRTAGAECTEAPVLGGVASATYKHGRYSKYMPGNLVERYRGTQEDEREAASLQESLRLITMKEGLLLEQMGKTAEQITPTHVLDSLRRVREAQSREEERLILDELEKMAREGVDARMVRERCWSELMEQIDRRVRVAGQEQRRIEGSQRMIAVEDALLFVQAFFRAAGELIQDREVLLELHARTKKLLPFRKQEENHDQGKGEGAAG